MEVAAGGDVEFAASHDGGFIWPDFLPAYDAAATLREAARPARGGRRARCRRSWTVLPERARRPRDRADAVGAQGRGDARRSSSVAGRARRRARRRREGASTTTGGRWCCPTPRRRSPTCGPRATSDQARAPARRRSTPRRIRPGRCGSRCRLRRAHELSRRHCGTARSTSGSRVDGEPRRGRHHRLRAGRARRRRVRAAPRGRCHGERRTPACAEIESTKSVSDIYAPVGGSIVEVNEALTTPPSR